MNKKGFALLSVLVITTTTTMLAFSQFRDNHLQERMAGNQQKEISARLAAEKGVFAAFEHIKEQQKASISDPNITSTSIAQGLEALVSADENHPFKLAVDWDVFDSVNNTFPLVSTGSYKGAFSYLKTTIKASEESESGSSLFKDAATGCHGVTVKNGTVDSYNSAEGPYDPDAHGTKGSVATIASDGDIILEGSGEVYGNLTSNGNISVTATVNGDITAVGDITLNKVETTGGIYAGGNLAMDTVTAASGNKITVEGNINDNKKKSTIDATVTYGGSSNIVGTQSASIATPDTDLGDCDPLNIVTNMPTTDPENLNNNADIAGKSFTFGEESSEEQVCSGNGNKKSCRYEPNTLETADIVLFDDTNTTPVYFFDELTVSRQTITVDGDVTLYVQGNITTQNATFVLADNSSSLTILSASHIDIGSNTTTVFADGVYNDGNALRINEDGEVPLTIYSSYASETDDDIALAVTSNADIYAKVYAPLGNVSLTGGGNIMGAVRGNTVTFNSSAGQIHYDQALAHINDIPDGNSGEATTKYASVYYYYPEPGE
ncbi:hypothetical protein CXF72_12485 [Psychromonas sp. MB-3u-54]|uniref:pilus assembly PilX N-terminal domain-containing protein n=1 Tax=Psychromonas sp. MB-3u-54 TaxID=2058319 RepID=UPI000C31C782|nr:pilus assembly PilX N-terminal domain-containing protein [Psychromonas sp. MB-3u-54]PKH02301.1 hypothetical protein CXF72_12485 [Psychromonas sp. MB-3u-54]